MIAINTVWEDYYQILQVHFMAEPEMIKNAYRNLSKKYHPDISKSYHAQEKMKAVIRAYEVLSDPDRRRQYFMKWVEKNSRFHGIQKNRPMHYYNTVEVGPAKTTLLDYLQCIAKKDYSSAFDMLSIRDQQAISRKDFIKWQLLVSEVFELVRYDCEVKEIYRDINLADSRYKMVAELQVKVVEKNHIMGRRERDELSKSVVYDQDHWSVFLGRNDLTTIINKFNELANLKKRHRIYTIKTHRGPYIEEIPGVLHKRAFLERAKVEQIRFNRYGNPFSVIICEMTTLAEKLDSMNRNFTNSNPTNIDPINCESAKKHFSVSDKKQLWCEHSKEIYRQIGVILTENIRNLDFVSRWNGQAYIIVLPETKGVSAEKAVMKIEKKIQEAFQWDESYFTNCKLTFRVAEQKYKTFKELYQTLT